MWENKKKRVNTKVDERIEKFRSKYINFRKFENKFGLIPKRLVGLIVNNKVKTYRTTEVDDKGKQINVEKIREESLVEWYEQNSRLSKKEKFFTVVYNNTENKFFIETNDTALIRKFRLTGKESKIDGRVHHFVAKKIVFKEMEVAGGE